MVSWREGHRVTEVTLPPEEEKKDKNPGLWRETETERPVCVSKEIRS